MSHPQVPVPQFRPSWVRYGPVPRYGHQTEVWQQPDPSQVRYGQPPSSAWIGNGQAVAGQPLWNGSTPQWAVAAGPTTDPAKVLGIVGLVFAFVFSGLGLMLCVIAVIRSKRAGFTNVPAIVGIVVGTLSVIIAIVVGPTFSAMIADCLEPGSGAVLGDLTTTCPVGR
jgi:hypothetical protein